MKRGSFAPIIKLVLNPFRSPSSSSPFLPLSSSLFVTLLLLCSLLCVPVIHASSVCSGNGRLNAQGSCVCVRPYRGADCNITEPNCTICHAEAQCVVDGGGIASCECNKPLWSGDGQSCTRCDQQSISSGEICSMRFDKAYTQHVVFPSMVYPVDTQGWTLEAVAAWVDPAAEDPLYFLGDNTGTDSLYIRKNGNFVTVMPNPDEAASSWPSSANTTFTVSIAQDAAGTIVWYRNGVETGSTGHPIQYPVPKTRTHHYAGLSELSPNPVVDGWFTEFRWWKSARTAAQISAQSQEMLSNFDDTDLVALYHVDKVCNSTMFDLTGNGRHAELKNYDGSLISEVFPSCSGHGDCVSANLCQCDEGYSGVACQYVCGNSIQEGDEECDLDNADCSTSCTFCPSGFVADLDHECVPECRNGGYKLRPGDANAQCLCKSGYSGDMCEIAPPADCPVGTANRKHQSHYPILNTTKLAFINNTLYGAIDSPLVNNRAFISVSFAHSEANSSCILGLPFSFWTTSVESCQDRIYFALPWKNHTQCGVNHFKNEGDMVTYKGVLKLVYTDDIGPVMNSPLTRTSTVSFDVYVNFLQGLEMSISVTAVGIPVDLRLVLTDFTYDRLSGELDLALSTFLNWPYQFHNTSLALQPPSGVFVDGDIIMDNTRCSSPAEGKRCAQVFHVKLGLEQGACSFDNTYVLNVTLAQCFGEGDCVETPTSVNFTASGSSICGSVSANPILKGTLYSYFQNLTTPMEFFNLGETAFFVTELSGDENTGTIKYTDIFMYEEGNEGNKVYLYQNGDVLQAGRDANLTVNSTLSMFSVYLGFVSHNGGGRLLGMFDIPPYESRDYILGAKGTVSFTGNDYRKRKTESRSGRSMVSTTRFSVRNSDLAAGTASLLVTPENGTGNFTEKCGAYVAYVMMLVCVLALALYAGRVVVARGGGAAHNDANGHL